MNPRIKQLALEAGYACPELATRMQKFAQLLIEECARICEDNGNSYQYSFTPSKARLAESTSIHCGELIKKYYGINT